jgi:hypothetical protein
LIGDTSPVHSEKMRLPAAAVRHHTLLLGNTLNDSFHRHPEDFSPALCSSMQHPRFAMLHL